MSSTGLPHKRAETQPKTASSQAMAAAGLKTFFRIAEAWALSTREQMVLLGSPPRATFFQWKRRKQANLARDTLERLSYILGIYKALQILLPKAEAADAWIKQPNSASLFGGKSALERMLSGNVADLYVVRGYLDAERGG